MFIYKSKLPRIRGVQTKIVAGPQIFDLLQISAQEEECRIACRTALRNLSRWRADYPANLSPELRLYMRVKSAMLRRQAWDSVLAYRLLKTGRRRMFADYIGALPSVPRRKMLVS